MTPRLLSEAAARDYLGGIDPRKLYAPRRFGRALRWDVKHVARLRTIYVSSGAVAREIAERMG